jgi:LysM repeat protein
MTDVRGPVRHGSRTRRPARPSEDQQELATDGPSVDLEAISAALAERSSSAPRNGSRAGGALRFAGLPLLLAAMVASAQPAAASELVAEPVSAPAAPHAPSEAWSVTPMQPTAPASIGQDAPATGRPTPAAEHKAETGAAPAKRAAAARKVAVPAAPVKKAPVKKAAVPAPAKAPTPPVTIAAQATPATPSTQTTVAPVTSSAGAAPVAPDGSNTAPKTPAQPAASDTTAPAGSTPEPVQQPVRLSYTVRPGDTLPRIADRSGRSTASLITLNKLRPDGLVVPGQVILLPSLSSDQQHPTSSVTAKPPSDPAPTPAEPTPPPPVRAATTTPTTHQPAAAKTPAAKTPATKTPAASAPAKDAAKPPAKPPIAAEPKARATAPKAHAATPAPTRPYLVVEGDTLTSIAKAHHTDVKTLLALNHLHLHSLIHPRQKLLLPAPPPPPPKTSDNTFLGRTYPPAVVAAANANRRELARRQVPTHAQTQAMVASTAKAMGVDPALVQAIAYQESGFDQHQVSPANAVGVMQIIPSAGKWASTLVGHPLDLLDPKDNVTAGVALLAALSAAAGNEPEAIAGYYQGLSSVQNRGMFDDTRRYVANVQTLKTRFATDA